MTASQMINEITSFEENLELICEEDRERYKTRVDSACVNKQGWNIEYCSYRAGQCTYLKETGEPVLDDDGRLIKKVGSTQDITEKRQGEETLNQSHALFLKAEALGNMGHFCWDLVMDKMISCSDQFARIFDLTVPEALDRFVTTEAVIDFMSLEDQKAFKQGTYLYSGKPKSTTVEYRIITHLELFLISQKKKTRN